MITLEGLFGGRTQYIQYIRYVRCLTLAATAAFFVTTVATTAAAATRTWDGGAADNNWTTAANWEGDVAPVAGDDLVFPAAAADKTTINDFPADTEFNSITFDESGYSVTGNRLVLASSIVKTGEGIATVSCDITLKGGAAGGPFDVIFSVPNSQGRLALNGAIGGNDAVPATLVKEGPGALTLEGANTFAGQARLVAGAVYARHAQAFGAPTAGTSVGMGFIYMEADIPAEPLFLKAPANNFTALACYTPAVCDWGGPIEVTEPNIGVTASTGKVLRLSGVISGDYLVTSGFGTIELNASNIYTGGTAAGSDLRLNGDNRLPASTRLGIFRAFDLNGFSQTIAGLTGTSPGEAMIGASTLTLDVPAGALASYGGASSGTGALIKKGEGIQYWNDLQAFTGLTTIQAGTFALQGNMQGPVALQGGTFRGVGTLKALTATGGRLEPGLYQNVGENTAVLYTDALTLGADVTVAIDINGDNPGDNYDQVRPQGAVTLGNATLELTALPDLTAIFAAMIVDNRSSSPIDGTFAGLPEGALISSNGKSFFITYTGGDGNDVVLQPASFEYFLSEGATGPFFDLDILIANPNATAVNARLTFLLPDGSTVVEQRAVAARSRITVRVDDIEAVSNTAVSTIVTSLDHLPLIVERTMRWGAGGYGAHTEQAVGGTALNWYFAEGAQGFFSTYLLLANPQAAPNVATVTYLRENAPAIVRTYQLAPKSRFTVDAGADQELVGRSFGMRVTFDQPGVAERAMYFGVDPFWTAGHESAGVNAPSHSWFLAEGATGSFFETFILIANPADEPSDVTVTFLPATGTPVEKKYTVPAFGRHTINIENEDSSLANAAVATRVSATEPVVVERAQYWPDPAPQWYEAHNSFGVTAARQKWGLAEGRVGGPEAYQTYILIANPYSDVAHVTITFLRENGTPFDKTFTVDPFTRFNVDVGPGTLVPELTDERFGAIIASDASIVVERAMYSNANGQMWGAGTNATGAPLP
jgi:autotransporter-associated beta strand protein